MDALFFNYRIKSFSKSFKIIASFEQLFKKRLLFATAEVQYNERSLD